MLPSEVVRGASGAYFVLAVASLLLFFPREARGPRTVRTSRPLSFVTGPLWVAILLVFIASLLGEAVLPDWVYDGPLTIGFPFDSVVQAIGLMLWPIGGGLAIWSMRTLGRFTRGEIEVQTDHRIVAEGPYRRIRHPLYAALLMMGAGVALFLLNALLLALAVLEYAIARHRASLEEGLLASDANLGPAYRRYMETTGRFFPSFGTRARGGG